jgi:Fe-S oxidoreductase
MIQSERLQEAGATGADVMLTGCSKCMIHFNCTQQGPEESEDIKIPVQDFLTFFANEIE